MALLRKASTEAASGCCGDAAPCPAAEFCGDTALCAEAGCWDNAVTVNSALKKIDGLAMASNAIWHVTLAGSNTATATFDPLTLPSALGYQISGTGYSGELTLLSGVTALPAIEWTAIQPTRQYIPQVTANGMGLYLRGRGTTITIR